MFVEPDYLCIALSFMLHWNLLWTDFYIIRCPPAAPAEVELIWPQRQSLTETSIIIPVEVLQAQVVLEGWSRLVSSDMQIQPPALECALGVLVKM